MPLVTAAQVIVVAPSDIDAGDILTTFIASADILVQEMLVPLGVLSEQRLTMIELYLSAHFLALTEKSARTLREATTDRTNFEQNDKIDFGLKLTRFGQMALVLDTTGTLANLSQMQKAATLQVTERRVLGTPWWYRLPLPPWTTGEW